MSVRKDFQRLKNTVLTGNCQKLREVLKTEYSYLDIEKVLSYALRYREFEVGKLLIDSLWGMQLEDTSFRLDSCLAISLVKVNSSAFTNIKEFRRYLLKNEFKSKNLSITPVEERLRFVHYFLEVSPNAEELFVPLLMLLSVCAKDFEMYEACQNEGYSLAELKDKYYYFNIMSLVSRLLKNLSYDDFMEVVPILIRDMPMSRFNFAYTICSHNCSKFSTPQGFELFCQMLLKHTPITRIMKYLISENKPDLLNIALNYGWLKNKTVRTNIFNYAQSINNPEIMAILLNYVNKNVDREKEALAEQKRQERLFNASPTSMLYLKNLWHFSICKDGTATVWGYKGDAVNIVIPSMIGKHKVTTLSSGTRKSVGGFKNIKSIVVPEGVTTIVRNTFWNCTSLMSIKLPSTL